MLSFVTRLRAVEVLKTWAHFAVPPAHRPYRCQGLLPCTSGVLDRPLTLTLEDDDLLADFILVQPHTSPEPQAGDVVTGRGQLQLNSEEEETTFKLIIHCVFHTISSPDIPPSPSMLTYLDVHGLVVNHLEADAQRPANLDTSAGNFLWFMVSVDVTEVNQQPAVQTPAEHPGSYDVLCIIKMTRHFALHNAVPHLNVRYGVSGRLISVWRPQHTSNPHPVIYADHYAPIWRTLMERSPPNTRFLVSGSDTVELSILQLTISSPRQAEQS